MRFSAIVFLLAAALALACSQSDSPVARYDSYDDLSQGVREFYGAGEFDSAIAILEESLDDFPDKTYNVTHDLAFLYCLGDQHDKALETYRRGAAAGCFFAFSDRAEFWWPMRELDGWDDFWAENERLAAEASAVAEPGCEVVTPEDYDAAGSYPLFLVLHGRPGNIEEFSPLWKAPALASEFVVAYVQSSQAIATGGYGWDDAEKARSEITACYQQVLGEYAIDPSRVIIGGFSQGGAMSIDVALKAAVPVEGFVALCPVKPEDFAIEPAREAASRGVRGVIITGDSDFAFAEQQEMNAAFDSAGLPCSMRVTFDLGHWFPNDFETQLAAAIAHIEE